MTNTDTKPIGLLMHRRALAYSLGHRISDADLLRMNRMEFDVLMSEDKRDLRRHEPTIEKNHKIEILREALKSCLRGDK